MHQIEMFFQEMKRRRVAFLGTGVTNGDVIRLFREKEIDVTLLDRKTRDQLGSTYDAFAEIGVKFRLGNEYLENLTDFDVIFRSPGVYYHNLALEKARQDGVVVTSEMEVFFQICPCQIYGITGSDGKTTTTTLISEFLTRAGRCVHKGGNIGRALLPLIETIHPDDVAVVELSSFQLLSMRQSPDIAVVTNIAPNHLDVHGTMDEYIGAKKNLLAHQDAFSKTILNLDNELAMSLSPLVRGKLSVFSTKQTPKRGAFLREDGWLCYIENDTVTEVVSWDEIRLPGMHNVENYLAAISAVFGSVPLEAIRETARTFGGVAHRIEFVRELGGVKWYNDSIATSPTRVLAGLNSFSEKLTVIMGGYDKKIPFDPMADTICEKVKRVILMGVTAEKIEAAIRNSSLYREGTPEIYHAKSMEEAVKIAKKLSTPGDVVTLSPACASFDAYPNFEARGEHYKSLVKEL